MKKIALLFAILMASCGADISTGSQGAGQQCFFPSDCMKGLSCYERVCKPIKGYTPSPDAGTDVDTGKDTSPDSDRNNKPIDFGYDLPHDLEPDCKEGNTRCVEKTALLFCTDGRWIKKECSRDKICIRGRCTESNNRTCIDEDGDGFGEGCERGPDCDDENPRVNPRSKENCNTPYDDNCNGKRNEGCEMDVCQFQDQPCSQEGTFENGYVCVSLANGAPLRCHGVCQDVPDPDSTCPDPNSICFLRNSEEQGICLSSCKIGDECGDRKLGCLAYGASKSEGVCVPIKPQKRIGSRCNPRASDFECGDNALCVNGRCTEACRPYKVSSGTDCTQGHCLPFTADIGVCARDARANQDQMCRRQNLACNQDAVGCYPNTNGGLECQRLCRRDKGNADCKDSKSCNPFDNQNPIGICQ